ncbi:MAG: methyltransferase domain-containing protein [Alphaproteobacteria bacterium]
MYLDVLDLKHFYQEPLGAMARHLLTARIRELWSNTRGQTVLGTGYAAPFLRPFLGEAYRVILGMPEKQGVIRWPEGEPSRTFLINDKHLPLADASVDKALAVHSLEMSCAPNIMLRELWRVLVPEGRLLIVVPNRRGLWARFDTTPYGHGHPYSQGQLEHLLSECLYTPTNWAPSLFMPPLGWRAALKTATAWERVGARAWPVFSGVLMVEAQKQLYAPVGRAAKVRAARMVEAGKP